MPAMDERLFLGLHAHLPHPTGGSGPSGGVTELRVPARLVEHVAQAAVYREDGIRAPIERVVPDAAVRLVFDLGTRRGAVDVAGPSAVPVLLRLGEATANLTVTLRPGAAGALLGIPASAIRDRCVPLEEIWPDAVEPLADRFAAAPDDPSCWQIVRSVLEDRGARERTVDRRRARRAQRVLAAGGKVRDAAAALGVGERRLQQIFETEVGLSPREYRRLARLSSCLRSLRGQERPRWSRLAADHGFFDQAHLSNEFVAIVGLTPTELLECISGSSKTDR